MAEERGTDAVPGTGPAIGPGLAATQKRVLAPNAIHLVRTTMASTLQLSQMADQKANMLMGAAFVVFTLSIGQLRSGQMILPIAILATGAFLAATCAILSVLPKVTHVEGPVGDDANILFFGIFTSMSEKEFADRIVDRLHDDEALYRVMLRDIHQNGQVLQRKKYRFLGYAYRLFLGALVLSFLAFLVEVAMGRMI